MGGDREQDDAEPRARRPQRLTSPTISVIRTLASRPTTSWWGFDLAVESNIRTGTIYPILGNLEDLGWFTSWWEDQDEADEGRPRRRYYRLTAEGARVAREIVAELNEAERGRKPRRRGFHRPQEQGA